MCRPQTKWLPASHKVRFQKSHQNPTTKYWLRWGTQWKKILVHFIQKRRKHLRITRGNLVQRGVWNYSAGYRISNASWPRTTCCPDRIYKHQFEKSQPRPLRGLQGTQRDGKIGAFREKADQRLVYLNIPGRSIWSEPRLCKHLRKGNYCIPFFRVRSGRISWHRGELIQVDWPVGCESSLSGSRTTSSGSSRVCNQWRKNNPWWQHCWHNIHYCVQ